MATHLRINNSETEDLNANGLSFGIIVADWNTDITGALLDGAYNTLIKFGAYPENIIVKHVPGTVEITSGAKMLAEYIECDAIICIGCVIKGDTPHFDYVCQSVTQGITQLNVDYDQCFIFGILTVNTHEQAAERAGGKLGNKGEEFACAAIKMANLYNDLAFEE